MTSQLARFRVFSQLPAAKKHTENGEPLTSLGSFLFHEDFSSFEIFLYLGYFSQSRNTYIPRSDGRELEFNGKKSRQILQKI